MAAQGYDKLVEALRSHPLSVPLSLLNDAADAISELQDTVQAQERALKECAEQLAKMGPKQGEWQWLSCTYDRAPRELRFRCSVCHHEEITHYERPWKHYCPNCGAYMQKEEVTE